MRIYALCLCALLAFVVAPAAQTPPAANDADKELDRKVKELDDKIDAVKKQQAKAVEELEQERARLLQERTRQAAQREAERLAKEAEQKKLDEINKKKRYLKVEIRGKLVGYELPNVKPVRKTYWVDFEDSSRCTLDFAGHKELQDLAEKHAGKEVIVSGTKRFPPFQPYMNMPTMMLPGTNVMVLAPPGPIALDVIRVESLKLAED